MSKYEYCFAVLGLLYLIGIIYQRKSLFLSPKNHAHMIPAFRRFQFSFLTVFLLAMAADWMQGPYVYHLYSFYGFNRTQNGILFIAGFASALLLGTWVGPLADMCGRKTACVFYCVLYILSCTTKHFNNFGVLIIGRILGGVSTSILWTVFESWMISEHHSRGFDPEWLGHTFSLMTTGNGLVAVVSGIVAQWAADTFEHPVAPFDASAILLIICMITIIIQWPNNSGSEKVNICHKMTEVATAVCRDSRIFFTGLQQLLFEGAMYVFIFIWTPALEANDEVPHGVVFASFMTAVSLGGMLSVFLLPRVLSYMPWLYGGGVVTMLVVAFSDNALLNLIALVTFEIFVGAFWPTIATLRVTCIPEGSRASIMSMFRAPLNAIVCAVLFFQGNVTLRSIFLVCALMHGAALWSAILLQRVSKRSDVV